MSSKDCKRKRTINELIEKMKRAKKRALKRAKRYNVGEKPPFKIGVIDGIRLSPYRMLTLYADRILPCWDGDPDDKLSIVETIDLKKLTKDLYIYCSSAARIVTRLFKIRRARFDYEFDQCLKQIRNGLQ